MDWLAENFATIDCLNRRIVFRTPEHGVVNFHGIRTGKKIPMISAMQAKRLIEMKEGQAFLVYLNKKKGDEPSPEDVEVVREFGDVFPKELSGLPPDRQLEFTIELEPRAVPISKASYRMEP